jgi:hypothetical protein
MRFGTALEANQIMAQLTPRTSIFSSVIGGRLTQPAIQYEVHKT